MRSRLQQSPSKQKHVLLNQASWTDEERRQWYHASAGTQLLPYDWFLALEDEPFKNNFARTGILPDPDIPTGLPVGFTKMEGRMSRLHRSAHLRLLPHEHNSPTGAKRSVSKAVPRSNTMHVFCTLLWKPWRT